MSPNREVALARTGTAHAPAEYRPAYFRASDTTYHQTTREPRRNRGGLAAGIVGVFGANGLLGWAAWAAHQACLHGNAHSVVAGLAVGAAAGVSALLAARSFASRTEQGAWAGTLLSPVSLILAGFEALLWAPGWPAAAVTAGMFGSLNGGLGAVALKLKREERRFNHDSGMQHDAIAGRLQENFDTQTAKTERKAIAFGAWFAHGYAVDHSADRTVHELHRRHPDVIAPPQQPQLPPGRRYLEIASGLDADDDLMAVAEHLFDDRARAR